MSWDDRWQQRPGDQDPDSWLVEVEPLLPVPGDCLDIACGGGRNGLWMARKGWRVSGVDSSGVGLELAREKARQSGITLCLQLQDLEAQPSLPCECCDVLLQFFYLQRSLLPALKQALRPGGIAVLRTFSRAGPFAPGSLSKDFVLDEGELLSIFSDWQVLRHEEGLEASRKGGSLAGIVARKPALAVDCHQQGRRTI